MSKKSAKRSFTSRQTPQPLNGIIAIVNCCKPLLSLVALFMDTSVEYCWAQITMKSVVSELSLGVIGVCIGVNVCIKLRTLYQCHTLLTHCPWYLMLVLKKIVSWRVAIGTKSWGELAGENVGWIPVCSCHDIESRSHITTRLLLLQTPFTTFPYMLMNKMCVTSLLWAE
jgi:hypothetical protein